MLYKINDNINIIKTKRKTIAVEIKRDLSIVIHAPIRMSDDEIQQFIDKKSSWIDKNIEKIKNKQAECSNLGKFTNEEIKSLAEKAKKLISDRAEYYAKTVGVSYGRITIRNQVTRWGSCSSKHNLNFNCLLVLCPLEVLDYVVVHELCHIKEMNHSNRFWSEIERICPNYETHRKWLKDNGGQLIERLR